MTAKNWFSMTSEESMTNSHIRYLRHDGLDAITKIVKTICMANNPLIYLRII